MPQALRILITGASGSGTTTLGRELSRRAGLTHFDADDYYWLPTDPPYREKRDPDERISMLLRDLEHGGGAVVSGSIMRWGEPLEDAFDLIVFLYVDAAIRVERLRQRELRELGYVDPDFIEWAAAYDGGTSEGRNLARHLDWLGERTAPVLRIEGDTSLEHRCAVVLERIAVMGRS